MSRRKRRSRKSLTDESGQSTSSARFEEDPKRSVRYNYRIRGPVSPVRVVKRGKDSEATE